MSGSIASVPPLPKPARRQLDPGYLDYLRLEPCIVPRCRRPVGPPHHVRLGTNGAASRKPDDCFAVPLCMEHHAELHTKGEGTFGRRHRLDLAGTAGIYWRRYQARYL